MWDLEIEWGRLSFLNASRQHRFPDGRNLRSSFRKQTSGELVLTSMIMWMAGFDEGVTVQNLTSFE